MILFFFVVKNPYDLRSQIRFWILPQKRTPRFFIGSYVIGNTEEIKLKGGGGSRLSILQILYVRLEIKLRSYRGTKM